MPPSVPLRGASRLIIAAPFGNYIQPAGFTPTLGTFTAAARGGRLWRILKTARYYPRLGAWVNQIGLRNPGIMSLREKVDRGDIDPGDKLLSIHGFTAADWWALLNQCESIKPLGIELNVSCPNVGEISWPTELFTRALETRLPVIVKVPPVRNEAMFDAALSAGVRTFHCCNTLPVPKGGLSGKPLMPLSLKCIAELRRRDAGVTIIGGGGVTCADDVQAYANAGADHVSVGTMVMHPKYLWTDAPLRPLIARAEQAFAGRSS